MKNPDAAHPFERAGLGIAPFRFVGVDRRVGPIRMADGSEVGSPGQPMGCCAYCSQGIAECCIIRDATGKTFIVGNVCVGKTLDAELVAVTTKAVKVFRNAANREKREAKRERDFQRDKGTVDAARGTFARPEVRATLAAKPHPMISGLTLADYADWMLSNAGMSGRVRVAHMIETAVRPSSL